MACPSSPTLIQEDTLQVEHSTLRNKNEQIHFLLKNGVYEYPGGVAASSSMTVIFPSTLKTFICVVCVMTFMNIVLEISQPAAPEINNHTQTYLPGKKKVEDISGKSCDSIQAERLQTLRNFCQTTHINYTEEEFLQWVRGDRWVLVVDKLRLMVTFVPKCMSSSLKVKLLEMVGEKRRKFRNDDLLLSSLHANGIRFLRTYSPKEILWRRDTYYKVIFVRHPLRRFLSAYMDKMRHIYNVYYPVAMLFAWRVRGLRAILTDPRKVFTKLTFEEFIINVLFFENLKMVDEHWKPAVDLALPCEMGFNFIGRVETAKNDFRCVFEQKLGQSSWNPFANQFNSTGLYDTYMSQIPNPLFKRLINLYEDDFIAFGYYPV